MELTPVPKHTLIAWAQPSPWANTRAEDSTEAKDYAELKFIQCCAKHSWNEDFGTSSALLLTKLQFHFVWNLAQEFFLSNDRV